MAQSSIEQSASNIEIAERSVRDQEPAGRQHLLDAVQAVKPDDVAAVYKQVTAYDANAHQQSLVEMKNGYLSVNQVEAAATQPSVQPHNDDPYDSVPHQGETFAGADGQKYYWNFADNGTNEYGFQKLKDQYGDKLVDHRIIDFVDQSGEQQRGMILEWRADR